MALMAWAIAATMRSGRRYTGWRWQYLARYIRRRDRFRCQAKGCQRQDAPLHVHHRQQVKDGGSYWPTNLVTVCEPCHERLHGRDLNNDGRVGR